MDRKQVGGIAVVALLALAGAAMWMRPPSTGPAVVRSDLRDAPRRVVAPPVVPPSASPVAPPVVPSAFPRGTARRTSPPPPVDGVPGEQPVVAAPVKRPDAPMDANDPLAEELFEEARFCFHDVGEQIGQRLAGELHLTVNDRAEAWWELKDGDQPFALDDPEAEARLEDCLDAVMDTKPWAGDPVVAASPGSMESYYSRTIVGWSTPAQPL